MTPGKIHRSKIKAILMNKVVPDRFSHKIGWMENPQPANTTEIKLLER